MAEYYYTQNSNRHGPIDLTELQALVSSGSVTGTEYYWTTGMADWATISTSGLFGAPASTPTTDMPSPTHEPSAADMPSPGDPIPSTLTGVPPGDASPTPTVPVAGATPAAAWSPTPVSSTSAVSSDQGAVQRVAAKMPKPLWLLITAIITGLSGLLMIVAVPIAAAMIWLSVLLFKTNSALENARRTGSLESLEKAANGLNTYFAILAVMTILSVVLMFLLLVAFSAIPEFANNF